MLDLKVTAGLAWHSNKLTYFIMWTANFFLHLSCPGVKSVYAPVSRLTFAPYVRVVNSKIWGEVFWRVAKKVRFLVSRLQRSIIRCALLLQHKPPRRLIRLEVIPVSIVWRSRKYFYSPLDEMLVHHRVNPSIKFSGTHLFTRVERGTLRVKCLAPQQQQTTIPG